MTFPGLGTTSARIARLALLTGAVLALLALYLILRTDSAGAGPVLVVDRNDDTFADMACTAAPNDCSLRGAFSNANTNPGPATIQLPADTYQLTIAGIDDTNAAGDLDVSDDLTIVGDGQTTTFIQAGPSAGNGIDRVIHVISGASLDLSGVTIRYGTIPGDAGAGIYAEGDLELTDSTVTENHSLGPGGGISVGSQASAALHRVTATSNISSGQGGGFFKSDGFTHPLLIQDSTFSMNEALGGGGIYVGVTEDAVIMDTVVSDNTADDHVCNPSCLTTGGGIAIPASDATIIGGSVTGNTSLYGSGGGVYIGTAGIQGTEISGNTAAGGGQGGGVYGISSAQITDALITQNHADGVGGGVWMFADGHITNTTISQNTTDASGGGVTSFLSIEIENSTIVGNSATESGGGFFVRGGTASVQNTTITNNLAGVSGGAIQRGPQFVPVALPAGGPPPGLTEISFTTIANNTAPLGSAIADDSPDEELSVGSTIISGNSGATNCAEPLDSAGYNVEDEDSCGLAAPGDKVNVDPLLVPLADNGGPTETHALAQASPAVDAGGPGCPPPNTDQRGVARPHGNACDAGAFESGFSVPTPTPSPTPQPTAAATPSPTPFGTPEPPTDGFWADDDCNGAVAATDALKKLQDIASLPYNVEPGCPAIGDVVGISPVGFGQLTWGDTDCDGDRDPVDVLQILRYIAALNVNQVQPCPAIGDPVLIF